MGTGVVGVRLVWESVAGATRRLNRALSTERDLSESIEAAFGRALYLHLSRRDRVAQAVSRLRAEQSGLRHLAAGGSVLEGVEDAQPVTYDGACILELARDWNATAHPGLPASRGAESRRCGSSMRRWLPLPKLRSDRCLQPSVLIRNTRDARPPGQLGWLMA